MTSKLMSPLPHHAKTGDYLMWSKVVAPNFHKINIKTKKTRLVIKNKIKTQENKGVTMNIEHQHCC